MELVDTMIRMRIDITRPNWVWRRFRELKLHDKDQFTGKEKHRNGVGAIVDKNIIENVAIQVIK